MLTQRLHVLASTPTPTPAPGRSPSAPAPAAGTELLLVAVAAVLLALAYVIIYYLLRRRSRPWRLVPDLQTFSRVYGLLVVATFATVLSFTGVSDEAKVAAYTILGTIAGYLAGATKTTPETDNTSTADGGAATATGKEPGGPNGPEGSADPNGQPRQESRDASADRDDVDPGPQYQHRSSAQRLVVDGGI
jgi:hypothetical protein